MQLARPGTMLVFDNVVREGGILDPDHPDPRVQGTRALFEAMAAEPRLSATAVQTVGAKKWDGLAIGIVG
jgi:predicted O-methyltransferase YrrM